MNFLCFLFIISTATLLVSSHPLMILVVILTQTLLICVAVWLTMKTSWFSFILFLIFLGGLMVLFVYAVSLAPNEKFNLDTTKSLKNFSVVTLAASVFFLVTYFSKQKSSLTQSILAKNVLIFSESMVMLTLIIMFYLLFALIVAVKISSKVEGPLRNFIK